MDLKERYPQNYGEKLARFYKSLVFSRFGRRYLAGYIEYVDWAVIPPAMAHVSSRNGNLFRKGKAQISRPNPSNLEGDGCC
jgi:hypothetical protein